MFKWILIILPFVLCAETFKTPRHVINGIQDFVKDNPGEYPFPTDLTFRKFANHIVDQMTETFNPDVIQRGDTIYLSEWYIPWWTKYIHPKIKHPYILITSDSDSHHPDPGILDYNEKNGWPPPVQATRTLLYDEKVAAWFCRNQYFSRHPKIVQIPIGPSVAAWNSGFDIKIFLELSKQHAFEKTHLAFIAFNPVNHSSRQHVINLFGDKPYVYRAILEKPAYIDAMTHSKYAFAPPGYGPDTVRFWEALLLDCIPIVEHFELDDLYAKLPVLFVHKWEDVNEELLKEKYNKIRNQPHKMEKIYFDYWYEMIQSYQEKIRKGTNDFSSIEKLKFKPDTLLLIASILTKFRKSSHDRLLTKGASMCFRPFQIVEKCPFIETVLVQDKWGAWGHEQALNYIKPYSNDPLLKLEKKGIALSFWEDPYSPLNKYAGKIRLNVFYDLSYIRCHLLEDLEQGYAKGSKETLFLGNLYSDPYVKEVLGLFAKDHPINLECEGDIWYFLKR